MRLEVSLQELLRFLQPDCGMEARIVQGTDSGYDHNSDDNQDDRNNPGQRCALNH